MKILKSGTFNKIITATGILGLFTMGALSSTYVKVKTPLEIDVSNADPISIQGILDAIAPGILPLIAVFAIHYYFKNIGQKYNKVILYVLLISFVAAFFGILA